MDANGLHVTPLPGENLVGFPSCDIESWVITKPTGYIGGQSDCYIVHTPCNP